MKFDQPAGTNPIDQLKVIGKPTDRIDGKYKTTGTARYAYERHDVAPNAAYGYVVGAGIGKGRISSMDLSAAKAALQSREREGATGAIHGGSFAAYSQTRVTQYDALSSEERQARGWSERTRDAAATRAAQTSGTMPSLFDQMG